MVSGMSKRPEKRRTMLLETYTISSLFHFISIIFFLLSFLLNGMVERQLERRVRNMPSCIILYIRSTLDMSGVPSIIVHDGVKPTALSKM